MEFDPRRRLALEGLEVEKTVDILFVLGTLTFLAFMYSQTFGLRLGTYLLPRLVIFYISAILVGYLAYTYTPLRTPVSDLLGISTDVTETIGGVEFVPTFVEIIWFVVYLVSLVFVGFFTTNFVYITLYIYFKDGYSPKRAYVPAFFALLIDGFLYLLIVEYLRSSAVFRLGILI